MNVSTGTSTDITSNSATVSGQIIDLGEGATQYGHYYGKTTGVKILVLKQQTECLKGQLVLRVNLIISMQELHIIIKHT